MSKPVIAIVGRPNVGKSTLFNKLIGQRLSIIEDTPGVTRDRIYAEGEWLNRPFILIDTGGIEDDKNDYFLSQMQQQTHMAIETADVIIMLTDLQAGVTAADTDIAAMLKKSRKSVILCVNKADTVGNLPPQYYEFYNLGIGDPVAVSSTHGSGTGDLLDAVFEFVEKKAHEEEEDDRIRVAVVGKPNVGKSSLINSILGENRVIVSDVSGTTRDAIDTYTDNKFGKYVFVDTAGIRKKSKVDGSIERYSVLRAFMAIERADVALIMIDARDGVTEQDTKIAGFAHEKGKACIIVANKWDLVEKNDKTMNIKRKDITNKLLFMSYAPILFMSAKTGDRVQKMYEQINYVQAQNNMRVTTGVLNEVLADAIAKVQPPSDKGKRLKLFYMTQATVRPPTFVIFVNKKDLFHFSYQRYIENQLRKTFGLEGTPIHFVIREKGEKK